MEQHNIDPFFCTHTGENSLPGINRSDYQEWLNRLLKNTRLIIEPKIAGSAIALKYIKGDFKEAISINGENKTEKIRLIKNIPFKLKSKKDFFIRGELFARGFSKIDSKSLTKSFLISRTNEPSIFSFCSFQIFNSQLNQYSQLQALQKIGFDVPRTHFTKFNTSEVEIYKKLWEKGELFNEYPTDGLVLKVNSRKLQKQLGENCIYQSWACAIKI